MKNADGSFNPESSKKILLLPLVPSEDEKPENLTALNSATFALRAQPADADLPKYKFTICNINRSEACRLLIEWLLVIKKNFTGLHVTTMTAARRIAKAMGTALVPFQSSMVELLAAHVEEHAVLEPNEGVANAL